MRSERKTKTPFLTTAALAARPGRESNRARSSEISRFRSRICPRSSILFSLSEIFCADKSCACLTFNTPKTMPHKASVTAERTISR